MVRSSRTCCSTWVTMTCAFGFTVSSLIHPMFRQTTGLLSPTLPQTHTLQYLRSSMTPQAQVKHTGRTRAQPCLRVCQEDLNAKWGSLTPVCTGTPSNRCHCYPHASETSPILFDWVPQIANLAGLNSYASRQSASVQTGNSEHCSKVWVQSTSVPTMRGFQNPLH